MKVTKRSVTSRDSIERTRHQTVRVAASSAFGGVVEYYDFFIFGMAAALVFPKLFFPEVSPTLGTIFSFLTFGAGFLARPLGSVIFGHLGDRYGRKSSLRTTLLLMGLATTAIGVLPTYDTIGVAAPLLLLTLRFLQGVAFGGEIAGAALMTVEHSSPERRGYWGSYAYFGSPVGQALATLVLLLVTVSVDAETFLGWGWRIPFVVSVVVVAVGTYLRHSVDESPVFEEAAQEAAAEKAADEVEETATPVRRSPLVAALRSEWRQLIRMVGLHLGITVVFYTNSVFITAYMTDNLGSDESPVLFAMFIANLLLVPVQILAGAASDRFGRRPVYLVGAAWLVLTPFPYFLLLGTTAFVAVVAAMTMFGGALYIMNGAQPAWYVELLDTRHRYSGFAISLSVATILGGATAPTVATLLTAGQDGKPWTFALYLMAVGVIVAVCAWFSPETRGRDLNAPNRLSRRCGAGD
jgi:MFS family permease